MCGIHGVVALRADTRINKEMLDDMGNITAHRGPDDSGDYLGEGVGIGMRRLSIIDLAGGHQPISNGDGTLWLVCNGEIYNFRELRQQLVAKGHQFKTASDSEVVLHCYAEYGDSFLDRLNGMFAFALWDVTRRRLVIARDRLGVKPLYYFHDDRQLIFATEAKAILTHPAVSPELDPSALQSYLGLGYVAAPDSIFLGIRKLPEASLIDVRLRDERERISIRRYWRLDSSVDQQTSMEQWSQSVRNQLEISVQSQMVSDVPIGAFLSGGIDSSAVVAFMAKHSEFPVRTYAIGFETGSGGSYYNELPYARQVADLFKTEHKEIVVKPDVIELLPKLLWHMDEPIADAAFITTFLVAQFAQEDSRVILSGVGGDELFGGYRRYLGEYYGRLYHKLPKRLREGLLMPLAKLLPSDRHSPLLNFSRYARGFLLSAELSFEDRYRRYVEVFNEQLQEQLLSQSLAGIPDPLGQAFADSDSEDPLRSLLDVDLRTQLPDDLLMLTDKMTMATSLECRVPFLDHELVEIAAKIPASKRIRGRELKSVLKLGLQDVLPKEILYRKKRGFGAPMGAWLKQELSVVLEKLLNRDSVEKRGLFNWPIIQKTIQQHASNREDHTDHLMALMNLEIWSRLYLDGLTPDVVSEDLRRMLH